MVEVNLESMSLWAGIVVGCGRQADQPRYARADLFQLLITWCGWFPNLVSFLVWLVLWWVDPVRSFRPCDGPCVSFTLGDE